MNWKYKHDKEYSHLIKRFPLVPIRSRKQHSLAISTIKLFFSRNLTHAESDYFDVLVELIKSYENKNVEPVSITNQEALAYLMELNDLSQSAIAVVAGTQKSHISEFFSGKRNLSKDAAAKLGARFKVDPMLFLPKVLPFARKSKLVNPAQHRKSKQRV